MQNLNLSKNQIDVLNIVQDFITAHGYPPTLREIMEKTNIKSLRGVAIQLEALEKEGYLKRSDVARGITLNRTLIDLGDEFVEVPLMSTAIPAGSPSFVDDYFENTIKIKRKYTKGLKNLFAVQVSGESMIDEGVESGDMALIYPQPVANDGEIVAALVDGGVTLKKYRTVEGIPMLFPANPDKEKYKPILGGFEIQGKLVNLIKTP